MRREQRSKVRNQSLTRKLFRSTLKARFPRQWLLPSEHGRRMRIGCIPRGRVQGCGMKSSWSRIASRSPRRERKSIVFFPFPFLFFLFSLSRSRIDQHDVPECQLFIRSASSFFSFFSSITLTLYEQQCTPLNTPRMHFIRPRIICLSSAYLYAADYSRSESDSSRTAAACFEKGSDI